MNQIPTCTFEQSIALYRLGCPQNTRLKWSASRQQTTGFDGKYCAYTAADLLKMAVPVSVSYADGQFHVCTTSGQFLTSSPVLEVAIAEHLILTLTPSNGEKKDYR